MLQGKLVRLRAHVWSDGRYGDLVMMGLLAEEWQQRHATPAQATPA